MGQSPSQGLQSRDEAIRQEARELKLGNCPVRQPASLGVTVCHRALCVLQEAIRERDLSMKQALFVGAGLAGAH